MKKILIGAIALLGVAAASCSKTESDATATSAATDSISNSFGSYVAANIAMQTSTYTDEQKIEFLNAFQRVFAASSTEAETHGALVAAQMLQTIEQFKSHDNIEFNTSSVINGFKRVYLSESNGYEDIMKYGEEFQTLRQSMKARSGAATANSRIATEYVNNLKANDDMVRTTDSGLTYKITMTGSGAMPTANSTVVVNYTGKHINGEVFDHTEEGHPATFNLRGVVPGFSEGLQLIGKGGKITLYIPGHLAYGADGRPEAGIGPNEMLIFELELLDVDPQN